MDEVWIRSKEFPEIQVSSFGRVLIDPVTYKGSRGGFITTKTKPTVGSLSSKNKGSYKFYKLFNRRLRINKNMSRLVAETFLGKAPFEGAVVMHLDDNPLNNRVSNLSWGAQKDNLNTETFIKYCKSRRGDDSPVGKYLKRIRGSKY